MGLYSQQDGTVIQTGHPIFTATSALTRGIFETKERQMYHSLQWRVHEHRTIISFQTVHFANQVSVYAAVTNWCHKFALQKEEEEHIPTPVDNRILPIVEPEDVEMLISSPNQAQGKLMMQNEAKFRAFGKERSHDPIV